MGTAVPRRGRRLFPNLSVFDNVRCAVLWPMGYRYSFWHRLSALASARQRAEEVIERIGLADRRDTPAGVLSYAHRADDLVQVAEQRALEIGITVAGGSDVILLDEPTAGMSRSESVGDPDLVMIDEPTEGLAPKIVEQVGAFSERSPGAASRCCSSSRSSPSRSTSRSASTSWDTGRSSSRERRRISARTRRSARSGWRSSAARFDAERPRQTS